MRSASGHIIVCGPIGAGKSTLTAALASALGFQASLEPDDSRMPFLDRFYSDPQRWAFHNQTFFIADAVARAHQIASFYGGTVQERCVWEVIEVFCQQLHEEGKLSGEEFELLEGMAASSIQALPQPNLMIVLEASTQTLIDRIRQRGRSAEQQIDPEYLASHVNRYERFTRRWDRCPKLVVDVNSIDFRDPAPTAELAAEIARRVRL